MFKIEQVTARSGSFSLKPLDLEIAPGECHALLGPSGAGKSTLLELIVGFRRVESGRIWKNGKDLAQVPVEKRGIGYLPQDLGLFPHLTVQENILYGIRCRRKPNPADLARLEALTAMLGLAHLKERRPGNLSGGERQRVALARALAPAPELLILDEPFAALNETLRRELWGLVKGLQQEYGVAMLMVTHDLEEAFFFGEQVSILIDGSLHQSGPRKIVYNRPATLEVARFLGIHNLFPAQVLGQERHVVVLGCESLGMQWTVNQGMSERMDLKCGDSVIVGIRSELMALHHYEHPDLPENLTLKGTIVEITETMHGLVLSFQPTGTRTLLKLSVGVRETAALDQNEVAITLPLRHVFYIPQKNGCP